MKYLTKKLRHRIYVKANQTHEGFIEMHQVSPGFCFCLQHAMFCMDIYHTRWNPFFHMDKFPEIYKHKPVQVDMFWWPQKDVETRREILKNAINETE